MTLGGPIQKIRHFSSSATRGCVRFRRFEQRSDCRAEPESNPGHPGLGKEWRPGRRRRCARCCKDFRGPLRWGRSEAALPKSCTRIAPSLTARRYPEIAESRRCQRPALRTGRVYSLDPNHRSTKTPGLLALTTDSAIRRLLRASPARRERVVRADQRKHTGLDSDEVFNHPANYLVAVQHSFHTRPF